MKNMCSLVSSKEHTLMEIGIQWIHCRFLSKLNLTQITVRYSIFYRIPTYNIIICKLSLIALDHDGYLPVTTAISMPTINIRSHNIYYCLKHFIVRNGHTITNSDNRETWSACRESTPHFRRFPSFLLPQSQILIIIRNRAFEWKTSTSQFFIHFLWKLTTINKYISFSLLEKF